MLIGAPWFENKTNRAKFSISICGPYFTLALSSGRAGPIPIFHQILTKVPEKFASKESGP
jgi:hypothetical protein